MKRIVTTLILLAAFTALGYYVFSHPNIEQVERLRSEFEEIKSQNEELARKNERLRKEIKALRDDPRLAERRAREQVGLAKPGEVILQFERPEEETELQVELKVESDRMVFAGEEVELDELPEALSEMHRQVPKVRLDVELVGEIGTERRRRVLEIIEDSPMRRDASDGTQTE